MAGGPADRPTEAQPTDEVRAEDHSTGEAGRDRGELLGPLLAILVLAAVLRAFALTSNPPEFFEDELSGAVSAWSIVTTGHDVDRTVLPFLTTRLELKQPLYFFATIPFQAVLGHDTLAARIPAVVFGVLSTALVIWLAARLSGRVTIGFAAGALFAVSPWAVHYGRVGWEPAALLPFTIGGIGLLWIGLEDHRRRLVVAAGALLAIGAYAYHPALLMHAVLAGLVALVHGRRLARPDLVSLGIAAVVALAILVPYGLALRDPLFLERTRNISVFKDGISLDALDRAWRNYWAFWNPSFLLGGASTSPRINPGAPLMLATVPFLLAGIDTLVHRRSRVDALLLLWIVVGPLTAAITDDGTVPSSARALFALPPLMVVAGIGAVRIVEWVASRVPERARDVALRGSTLALAGLVLVEVYAWTGTYFNDYPVRSGNSWGYGVAAAFDLVRREVPPGGLVCVAENDVSSWTFLQAKALYLPSPAFTVIEDLPDDPCLRPGSYQLVQASRKLAPGLETVGVVRSLKGDPRFLLVRVPAG